MGTGRRVNAEATMTKREKILNLAGLFAMAALFTLAFAWWRPRKDWLDWVGLIGAGVVIPMIAFTWMLSRSNNRP